MACCTTLSTPDAAGTSSARTVDFTSFLICACSLSFPPLNRAQGMPNNLMVRFFLSVIEESTVRPQQRTSVTHRCLFFISFPVLPAVMNEGNLMVGKSRQ